MAKNTKGASEVFDFGESAFLAGGAAMVIMTDSRDMVGDVNTPTQDFTFKSAKEPVKFVRRGANNKLPIEVMEKVYAQTTVGANIEFNSKMAYGDGIMVMKKVKDPITGDIKLQEQLPSDYPEIFKFLEDNNYINSQQEWANDLSVFYESFCEIILEAGSNKIYSIQPVESINSRVSLVSPTSGKIEYHGFCLDWPNASAEKITLTPLLDRRIFLMDLKRRLGIELDPTTKKKTVVKDKSFMLQLMLPTPGRYYNGKPYWWSIFTDWYDFACAIPAFKKALLKNQMVLKYDVKINITFWDKLFKQEAITEPEAKKVRRAKFLTDMNNFLSGGENAGKSFVSHFEYDKIKGYEINDIIIKTIDSFFKGGEYIDDSEEVTNIISGAMGVHPSIVGATPGKGKSINGTEARELFIIKQAMMKPIRDLLVAPLYLVKAINGWDPDVFFIIPNIMLTTLDQGTGAVKAIGNQKV